MLNHKLIYCACFLLISALLVSADEASPEVVLVKHVNEQNLNGAGLFKYAVETDHGIKSSAVGDVNGVRGEYFLPGEEGQPPKHVTYEAGPSGFKANID